MCSLFHLCRSRGWELYHEGKLEEAIAEWRIAADLDPEDGYILTAIGLALSELGRQEEAFSEWWQAIHLEPEYNVPYIYLANALFESGYAFKALTTIRTALRHCPASANLHIRLGHYLATQANEKSDEDRWQAAGAAFQQALDVEPANIYALSYLAKMQWLTGKKQEAIVTMTTAVSVVPNSFDAHMQLAIYQFHNGSLGQAIRTYRIIFGLAETQEAKQFFARSTRLMKRLEIILYVSAGLTAVLAGIWIWQRRRG